MMSQIAELAAMTSSRPAFVIGIRAKYRKRSSGPFDHRHRTATLQPPAPDLHRQCCRSLVNVVVGSRALIERHVTRVDQDVFIRQPAIGLRLLEVAIGSAP